MTISSVLGQIANLGSAAFAIGAAFLWFRSARIETPDSFPVAVNIIVSSYDGSASGDGSSLALSELGVALKRQSQLSAQAAICAGVAAILGAAALLLPLLD
jgi:hypothetical protein